MRNFITLAAAALLLASAAAAAEPNGFGGRFGARALAAGGFASAGQAGDWTVGTMTDSYGGAAVGVRDGGFTADAKGGQKSEGFGSNFRGVAASGGFGAGFARGGFGGRF